MKLVVEQMGLSGNVTVLVAAAGTCATLPTCAPVSRAEFMQLAQAHSLRMAYCGMTPRKVMLDTWMDLTRAPEEKRERIRAAMKSELAGGEKTGLAPYAQAEKSI